MTMKIKKALKLELSSGDLNSDTWKTIEEYLLKEVESLRDRLEVPTLEAVHTAVLRGRLRAIRKMLKARPKIAEPDGTPTE